jgi:hypothetical protein
MRRAALAPIAAAWLLLAGCPLPQALPEYTAGTVTPPRILVDEIATSDLGVTGNAGDGNPIVFVPASCTTAPVFTLSARVVDTNNSESIDSRWFVNYDPRVTANRTWVQEVPIAPNTDPTNLVRNVPSFAFAPYDFAPAPRAPPFPPQTSPTGTSWYPQEGIVRIVELVVSNGFDPSVVGTAPLANRAPKPSFETQVYRWVFLSVPESTSVPCPAQ